MSFGPAARAMVDAAVRHFSPGARLTLRRDSTVQNVRTSAAITAFTLGAAAAEGATEITLISTDLRGRLVAGSKIVITGDATVYTTTADVDAAESALTDIPITPPLALAAAESAPANLTQLYADETYEALEVSHDRETASSTVDGSTRRLGLVAAASRRAPKEKDRVVSGFPTTERVLHVSNVEPQQGFAVRWDVVLGNVGGVA